MPSAITSAIGGIQGGTPPPYTNAPGLSPRQAQNIMQQLRSGAGLQQQAAPQSTMTPLSAGAPGVQQALMSRLPGGMGATATPQSTISALPAGAQMGGFNGFGGMSPIQPSAYAQAPPQQPQAWGPNPFAFMGGLNA